MAARSTREVVRGYYDAWTSRDLDCETGPAGTIRTAEAFTVRDGKIREIRLVFDPTELIKLGWRPE
jgi:hypothetical protein